MRSLNVRFAMLAMLAVLGATGCASSGGGNSYFSDAAVTTRVKRAIYNEPSLKVMDVGVTTDDGVVELTGTVKTRGERAKASEIARKAEGVKRVKNELKVQPQ